MNTCTAPGVGKHYSEQLWPKQICRCLLLHRCHAHSLSFYLLYVARTSGHLTFAIRKRLGCSFFCSCTVWASIAFVSSGTRRGQSWPELAFSTPANAQTNWPHAYCTTLLSACFTSVLVQSADAQIQPLTPAISGQQRKEVWNAR